MRKLITDYPVFSIIFASCLGVIIFNGLVIGSLIFLGFKSVKYLSESASNLPSTNSKSDDGYTTIYGKPENKDKILAIPIYGPILTEKSSDPWESLYSQFTYGYDVKKTITDAAEKENIKGIIFLVDSPGGTVTGSKAIADAVEYYKSKTKKPVITYVSGMNASGAYLATVGSDLIVADRGTLIGSVGVIMGPFKKYNSVVAEGDFLGDVTTTGGIESYYLYAGKDKDFGNPYKDMPTETRDIIQQGLDDEYNFFLNQVSTARNISYEKLVDEVGARAFGVEQAWRLSLVDFVSTRDQALIEVAKRAGLDTTNFTVVTTKRTDFFDKLFGLLGNENLKQTVETCSNCEKMYFLYGTPEKYFKYK